VHSDVANVLLGEILDEEENVLVMVAIEHAISILSVGFKQSDRSCSKLVL
jgi:hypothetical protein